MYETKLVIIHHCSIISPYRPAKDQHNTSGANRRTTHRCMAFLTLSIHATPCIRILSSFCSVTPAAVMHSCTFCSNT